MESLGIAPYNLRQALTRLEGTPDRQSILVLPGKVPVHQLTCHFPSLLMGSLRWVRRRGDRRWKDPPTELQKEGKQCFRPLLMTLSWRFH